MRIDSIDKDSFIVLDVQEHGDDRYLSVRIAVELQLGEFRGRYDRVWLDQAALEQFVDAARQLERTRQGSVALESMSPNDFRMQLKVVDAAGHIAVAVALRRRFDLGRTRRSCGLEGEFELEPSLLPAFVRGIATLAAKA